MKLRILNTYEMVNTIPNEPKDKIYLRNIWQPTTNIIIMI